MPIVIVRFTEPIAFEPRINIGTVGFLSMDLIDQVTLVTSELPVLRHYDDGESRRGYLDCGDGVEFDARKVEDVRIIL